MLQVRAVVLNGDIRQRLAYEPPKTSLSIPLRMDNGAHTAAAQNRMTTPVNLTVPPCAR